MNFHNITICPVNKVMEYVESGKIDAVLTILSQTELNALHGVELTENVAFDFEYKPGNNFEGIEKYIKKEDWKIFKIHDYLGGNLSEKPIESVVKDAISFGINKLDEGKRLLIHCQMGMSRSPAIAYLILCHYEDPQDAINDTYKIRQTIKPNEHIVTIGDAILKLQGAAINALKNRKQVNGEINKSFQRNY